MRFARYVAAAILIIALLTPLREFVRTVAGASGDTVFHLAAWVANAKYFGILVASYVVLLFLVWGARRLLQLTDNWEHSGLSALDRALPYHWPRLIALGSSVLALLAALLGGFGPRVPALIEAVLACVAVLAAIPARAVPQLVPEDEDYDPLPEPRAPIAPPPPPGPAPAPGPMPSPGAEDAKPLSLWWYFEREPGHPGGAMQRYDMRVTASTARYEELSARDHGVSSPNDYARFARDGLTPEMEQAVVELRNISTRDRLGSVREINNVLAFAQQFEYAPDTEKGAAEWPKYPLETLYDDRGDCEDHAIVAAACLYRLGYNIRLVDLSYRGSSAGHMALAVQAGEEVPDASVLIDHAEGTRYYYCEPTTNASSRHEGEQVFRIGDCDERLVDATKVKLIRVW